ncbi:MAG: FAD-binding oxidoreductase [Myxococcota bacterium]
MTWTTLHGWGAQRRVRCDLRLPETAAQVRAQVDDAGTIARGLGRSYGDQALNEGGRVLQLTSLDRYLAFDEATGTLTCEAGVSLAQLIADFAPRGFFPAVTPGTKFVTVGGCIANDVHGKAHHAQGTFATCVQSMRVLVADGRVVNASRTENADLFWGTFGGLGLLGVVLDATLTLRKVETTYFRQRCFVARDLDHMLELLAENDHAFPYSVATLDITARGRHLGRGVLTVGDHARKDELPAKLAKAPLRVHRGLVPTVPFELPELTLNPLTIRAVNVAISTLLRTKPEFDLYQGFFYPLDIANDWYRGYGRRGFIQYQFVVPFDGGPALVRRLLERITRSDQLPFLNILKRFGPANEAPLSFPTAGLTFAVDFPVREGLLELTRELDEVVADAGGRIYLGKDSYLTAAMFRRMYARYPEWAETKAKWDPRRVFTSDLARRLEL